MASKTAFLFHDQFSKEPLLHILEAKNTHTIITPLSNTLILALIKSTDVRARERVMKEGSKNMCVFPYVGYVRKKVREKMCVCKRVNERERK